ncbi:methyl-accepting chemotaxis protein [Chromohalobacter nigrandesensis]|uniref:methyl-accepting chemotaxis protein n=1 Tax=Chromohalobacter nigrandesensis TaxID=119863 RepID=UPI001FF2E347|nr:methyl-accepting chemotaxis protein [Chromohalobacter nigrandesensis]MCK0745875.1 methyl-accepting chemotaxis protein [Chromohalobacter nigrandesensis]
MLMSIMRRFSVRVRMLGAIVVVLALLGVLGGTGMWGIFRLYDASLGLLDQGLVEEAQAGIMAARLSEVAQGSVLWFGVMGGLTVLIVAPLTWLNMRAICTPVREAKAYAEAIAEGDLTRPMAGVGQDELSELQTALGGMRDGLGGMVAQVRDASDSVAIASEEIALGNQDLASRTEHSLGHLQQSVTSITQLTSSVQQTAYAAQRSEELATHTAEAAVRGGDAVKDVVTRMRAIAEAEQRIGDIVGLIDDIAFQTNLLALNASVEAARAGGQGRGFAVVASEVRNLAGRSATAASEIKTLIHDSRETVESGVQQAEATGATIEEIVTGVQRVSEAISEISAATREQSQGIEQVSQSVERIDRMIQQNAALVEESAAAASSLHDQSTRLASVVHRFQLMEVRQDTSTPTPDSDAVCQALPAPRETQAHAAWA